MGESIALHMAASAIRQGLELLKAFVVTMFWVLWYLPHALLVSILGYKEKQDDRSCDFYEGNVVHIRKRPIQNSFRYSVRMAVVDLESPPSWWENQAADHLTVEGARHFAGTKGGVKLLTHPMTAGYIQNPISVYYCYNEEGTLERCIAEVTNTPWGDRVTFPFDPAGQTVPKSLHVSPLMDMKSTWTLRASEPGGALFLSVAARHQEYGDFFVAELRAARSASSLPNELAGLGTLLRYGFQPQRVALLIYWQALKLLWKGLPFINPPGRKEKAAIRERAKQSGVGFCWKDTQKYPWKAVPLN